MNGKRDTRNVKCETSNVKRVEDYLINEQLSVINVSVIS